MTCLTIQKTIHLLAILFATPYNARWLPSANLNIIYISLMKWFTHECIPESKISCQSVNNDDIHYLTGKPTFHVWYVLCHALESFFYDFKIHV